MKVRSTKAACESGEGQLGTHGHRPFIRELASMCAERSAARRSTYRALAFAEPAG